MDIDYQISRDRRPLYVQALEALTTLIDREELKAGDQLPSEEVLAARLGVSRSTLREALGYMETHGMISRQQGRGTFITKPFGPGLLAGLERMEPFRSLANRMGLTTRVIERSVELKAASPAASSSLNIEDGTALVYIESVEAIREHRCMLLEDYLIADEGILGELAEYKGSLIQYLIDREKQALSHTRSEIFAVDADERIAEKLNIQAGTSVLKLVETYLTSEGDMLGFGNVYFLTEHFHFFITRRVLKTT
jgi:GntR family transcriptional regulator